MAAANFPLLANPPGKRLVMLGKAPLRCRWSAIAALFSTEQAFLEDAAADAAAGALWPPASPFKPPGAVAASFALPCIAAAPGTRRRLEPWQVLRRFGAPRAGLARRLRPCTALKAGRRKDGA